MQKSILLKTHVSTFDWCKAFKNRNVNKNSKILQDTFMDVFANFIPHKTRKFNDKSPEWMNKFIILSLNKSSKLAKNVPQ